MNIISALIKEAPERSSLWGSMWGHSKKKKKKKFIYEPQRWLSPDTKPASMLNLDFQELPNKFLLFISCPVYGIFFFIAA